MEFGTPWTIRACKLGMIPGVLGQRRYLWTFVVVAPTGQALAEALDFEAAAWGVWGRWRPLRTAAARATLALLVQQMQTRGAQCQPPRRGQPWYAWRGPH